MIPDSLAANLFALSGTFYLLAVAWPLALVDLREHRLPNGLVLPAFPIAIVGELIGSALSNQWLNLGVGTLAAVVAFAIGLAANHWASLGMGDVKLITAITLSLAWFHVLAPLVAVVLSFVLASAVVLIMLALRKTALGSSVALGPYLLFGFAVTQILTWSTYLGGFSPNFFM